MLLLLGLDTLDNMKLESLKIFNQNPVLVDTNPHMNIAHIKFQPRHQQLQSILQSLLVLLQVPKLHSLCKNH